MCVLVHMHYVSNPTFLCECMFVYLCMYSSIKAFMFVCVVCVHAAAGVSSDRDEMSEQTLAQNSSVK